MIGFRRRRRRGTWAPADDAVRLVQALVLVQAGLALLSTLEVAFMGLLTGAVAGLAPVIALTGATAVGLLVARGRLDRRSRRWRRAVVCWQWLVLAIAAVDLALALVLTQLPLDPAPALTRIALPLAILWLLRRPRLTAPVAARAGAA